MGEIQRHIYQDVLLEGHLIDSNILSRIMGNVMELGGDFEFLTLDIGRQNTDPSRVRMRVFGKSADHMQQMLARLTSLGASPEDLQDAQLAPSPADGVFPENFYSTTNLVTAVHLEGQWRTVPNAEMDLGLRYNPTTGEVRGVAISDARKGDLFVVGNQGLRVTQQERPREIADFEFMELHRLQRKAEGPGDSPGGQHPAGGEGGRRSGRRGVRPRHCAYWRFRGFGAAGARRLCERAVRRQRGGHP